MRSDGAARGGSMWTGALCGLGAAVLFGVSAPIAKGLLPKVSPLMLAGLLYLGAGIALSGATVLRGKRASPEARLQRVDLPWLAGIVLLGGIVGPVLMLHGLGRVSAVAGSLLLNLEAPFTILAAALLFREHVGRRSVAAAALVVGGAAVLGYRPGELRADGLGILAIAGACASWALDNNFTQRLTLRDPTSVVRFKALGAGACTTSLALLLGEALPTGDVLWPALVLGAASYGVSIVLDMYALRMLGAAREATFFATAPFIGALAAIPILGERMKATDVAAGVLMAAGVLLLLRERHAHLHAHEQIEHEHLHHHDAHHRHSHPPGVEEGEPHSHFHRHAALVHDHPHLPDLHHRHRHRGR